MVWLVRWLKKDIDNVIQIWYNVFENGSWYIGGNIMFSLYDIIAEYDLTYNELCELLENVSELTGEDTIGIICALDNIYNGEED